MCTVFQGLLIIFCKGLELHAQLLTRLLQPFHHVTIILQLCDNLGKVTHADYTDVFQGEAQQEHNRLTDYST